MLEMKAEDVNLPWHCSKNLRSCGRNTSLEMLLMVNKTVHHCQQEKGLSAVVMSVFSELKLVCKIVMF